MLEAAAAGGAAVEGANRRRRRPRTSNRPRPIPSPKGNNTVEYFLHAMATVDTYGPAAPIVFILIYAIAVVALIPASLLTIAGGALFGVLRGALYAVTGAALGSTSAFLLGRYVARRAIAQRLARLPRGAALDRAAPLPGLPIA